MSKSKGNSATLYVVGVPIGNYRDITLRAIDTLSEVDVIVGEDTRRVRALIRGAGIETRAAIMSFHERSRRVERGKAALNALKAGKRVALVTDSGTPCISDPGHSFIDEALKLGADIVPVPGPSALACAVSVSSISAASDFTFIGYPPARKGRRKKLFEKLASENRPFIFFESPRRLIQTLNYIIEIMGDAEITVGREMTKSYEEIYNGSLKDFLAGYEGRDVLGEVTVIISSLPEKGEGNNPARIYANARERN